MTTTIKNLNGGTIKISAKLNGTSNSFINDSEVYKYKVTVVTAKGRASFDYHTSIADFNAGKNTMDEQDLLFALDCFIGDAISGEMRFDEFCREFGYDEDSRRAEKIHRACQRAADKAKRIFTDLYDMANHVRELQEA